MRGKRLARQLFLPYLWITIVVVVVVGLYGAHTLRRFYLEHLGMDLEARARLCARQMIELLERDDTAGVDVAAKELGKTTSTRITVILPSGEVLGDTEENPRHMDNHKHRPEVQEALDGAVGQSTRYSATLQEEFMYVAVPVYRNDSLAAIVRTSVPVTAIDEALGAILHRILVGALVATGLIAAVSLWISLRISGPLEELKVGAERFARGELDHRLRSSSTEEIGGLAEAMNRMAEQLDERIQTVLRQQNELEAVLGSMEEGVLAIDNEGTVLNLNEACGKLLGSDPEKLKGRIVHEVIRKSDFLQFVESSLSSPSSVEGDIRICDTEDRWFDARGTALYDAQRRKIGVLIVFHDVTRLRRLEKVRSDFVANVSHELKTPITSIKGFVETLLDGAVRDEENAVRFLRIVSRQVNRLEAIVEDLLTLSWLEKGSEEHGTRLESGPVRDVLQAATELCEKKAADKDISIQLECDKTLAVEMNAPMLEQAVVNLVDNAIKYSETGDTVDVTAALEQHEIVIRVADSGHGIESKHLPRLFERFYRADKARSRELGGTGLGLAIVKHIVLAHRGSVHVESTIGRGSTFSIHLPPAGS